MRTKHKLIRTAMSFVLVFVPFLMVMGLLAPVFGPAFDHHYADRSPAHAHALTGPDTIDHSHSLGDHDHADGVTGDGVSVVSTSVSTADCSSTLDGATLESSVPTGDYSLVALHDGASAVPDEESITPLDRPPRLS